jgi:hypothetical protein
MLKFHQITRGNSMTGGLYRGDEFQAPAVAAVNNPALTGISTGKGAGVTGHNQSGGAGVIGTSENGSGVVGRNLKTQGLGLLGGRDKVFSQNVGVYGESNQQGVFGHSTDGSGTGVYGSSVGGSGFGVRGESHEGIAVQGQSFASGIAIQGIGGRLAGRFEGNVEVTGHIRVSDVEVTGDIRLVNADCAEDFDIAGLERVEPGTVMVIDSEGSLRECDRAYDKCVAGVISGAGKYKPAIVLDKQESSKNRMPIALMGKVYCKVDASYGAIEVGDLLTTSPTPGHAMKADDPMKAFGAVIGKALRPLEVGQDLIPVLVALQ